MGLTGCPPSASAAQRAAERVEALALIWQALDGDAAYCANPRLAMVTRVLPELLSHPASALVGDLRREGGRDGPIKGLVRDACGLPAPPDLAALAPALDALSDGWAALAGGLRAPLAAAYREMRGRADPLAAGLDPAADLARITGEADAFDVLVLPSLFLPPPQTGRHSVLVDRPGGRATGFLHYGFPLDVDPSRFGIGRAWLMGGAWHYAVSRFLARHWPALARRLRARPAVEAALTAALAEHREAVPWPGVVAEHVSVALKALLCARAGMPETVHRSYARAQGLALFDWFRAWAEEAAGRPGAFAARLGRLDELAEARLGELAAAAAAASSGPDSINFALSSRQHRPVLVVPDHWDEALLARIGLRWSLVSSALLRAGEWRGGAGRPAASAVVFGEVGRDAAVDELLGDKGRQLGRSPGGGDVLVSLLAPGRARHPWRIAVGVHDPEAAGGFSAEHAVGLFHRTARFSGHRFVDGDGLAA